MLGHESFHLLLKALKFNNSPQYKNLMTRLRNMERILGKGEGSRWFKEAYARIPAADRLNEETRLSELAAYTVEQYESAPRTLPEALAKWVNDFIADVKAWLHDKAGVNYKGMTAADLSAMARRFLRQQTVSGKGRAQPLSAQVLTSDGYRRMGDIQAGDKVIAVNGDITQVDAVFPQGRREIYRITISDGASTRSTSDHLWSVRKEGEEDFKVMPLAAIMEGMGKGERFEIHPLGQEVIRLKNSWKGAA
ncbi:hypothetical protein AGMMS50256_37210 [Betaproteobacteria bacterium]|nr:hypothetical protein AGMMS50256_37210 [Betaproteobacteria bacterium]